MLKRYPHIAKIILNAEVDSEDGISESKTEEFFIEGRYEPNVSKSKTIDYKAKFYCLNIQYLYNKFIETGLSSEKSKKHTPFLLDGQTLVFENRKFEIVMFYNYQSHCEIWLE